MLIYKTQLSYVICYKWTLRPDTNTELSSTCDKRSFVIVLREINCESYIALSNSAIRDFKEEILYFWYPLKTGNNLIINNFLRYLSVKRERKIKYLIKFYC